MEAAGAHLIEHERWRRRLECAVVAPTGHGAVRLEPAGVLVSCAYERERTGRGRRFAVTIFSPNSQRGIRLKPVRVAISRADVREPAGRGPPLAVRNGS